MKRTIYLMSLLFMAGAIVFTSCTKDDDTPVVPVDLTPAMNFLGGAGYISDDATLIVGELFQVGVSAIQNGTSQKKLESFIVTRTFNNITVTVLDSSFSSTTFNWSSFQVANPLVGEERWTFTVTDKDGKATELAFIITTESGGLPVFHYPELNMGSYDDSDYGSFMSTLNGNVLTKDEATAAQALIDFAFYNGDTNGMTFGAPSNQDVIDVYNLDWTTMNETLFMPSGITADEFDAIGDTYVFPSFTGDADDINELNVGDVIYFKTIADNLGYLKINSSTKDGFEINIDIKMTIDLK